MKQRKVKSTSPMGGVNYTGTVKVDPESGRVESVKTAKCTAVQPTTGVWASKIWPWNWGK